MHAEGAALDLTRFWLVLSISVSRLHLHDVCLELQQAISPSPRVSLAGQASLKPPDHITGVCQVS